LKLTDDSLDNEEEEEWESASTDDVRRPEVHINTPQCSSWQPCNGLTGIALCWCGVWLCQLLRSVVCEVHAKLAIKSRARAVHTVPLAGALGLQSKSTWQQLVW
jgi:hypothetical protein